MFMNGAIAVFVKTPGQSPVKTRLAASLGRENAELFHLTAARSVVSVTQQMKAKTDIKNYYAVAEQSALEHHYWQDLPCLWQGEGGLGSEWLIFIKPYSKNMIMSSWSGLIFLK